MIRQHRAPDAATVLEYLSPEGNFFLSSRVAPIQEAKRILGGEFEEDVDMVIVFGAGHIPLIEQSAELFRSARVAVVEKEDVILQAAKPLLANTVTKLVWLSGESIFKDLEVLLLEHPSRRIKFIHNRTEIRLWPDFYQKVKNEIVRLHDKKSINSNTLQRFERIWLRNVTGNTEAIIRAGAISDLRGMGKGLHALMIAAGPSLGKQLELIRASQGKAVLVAADTVYKTLLNNGIHPDLVVVVDPQKINSRYVEHIPEAALQETIFVAEPAVIPKALEGSRGRTVMFNTIFPYYAHIAAHFGDKGNVDMGGSVATTAFDICAQMGFERTLVVGLDLSFKEDAYHVPGTMYEEHWFSDVRRFKTFEMQTFRLLDYFNLTPVKDQLGDTVYMDSRFVLFRAWFEKRLEEPGIQDAFRNGTAGGIPLKNLERQDLAAFLASSETDGTKKDSLQHAIRESIQKRESIPAEKVRSFVAETREILGFVETYRRLADEAAETCAKTLKLLRQKAPVSDLLEKLDGYDQKLGRDFPGKAFVNIALQKAIGEIERGEFDFEKVLGRKVPENEKPLESSYYLYQEMREVCDLNLRYIRRALDRLVAAP